MATMKLEIGKIRVDGGTQSRVATDADTVKRYAEALTEEKAARPKTDPMVAYFDGTYYWLASGFHWLAALRLKGEKDVSIDVKKGSKEDAIVYSVGCNHSHGLPLSRADKRHKVKLLLALPDWAKKSNSLVAAACKVSDHTVAEVRAELEPKTEANGSTSQTRSSKTREGKDGKQRAAARPAPTRPAKNGAVTFDWKTFTAAFGALYREIDRLGNAYKCKDSPEAEGLRRLLREWRQEFRKVFKVKSGQKPPEE